MGDDFAAIDDLEARAEHVGLKVDGRWGPDRLREEVEAAEAAAAVPPAEPGAPIEEDSDITDTDEAPDAGYRAGGHIDRGDGKGWMVEE
jgi:hypothetical protein